MAMQLLNPWALVLGAVSVGLPIAVHLLTRPRPKRMALPTVRFLRGVIEQKRSINKLRDWLLLLLRTLAVTALAFAFARPLLGVKPLVSSDATGDATRVVIVDVSQSMTASQRGISPIERAREVAAAHLAFHPGLRASLILAGESAEMATSSATANFAALREQLASAAAQTQRTNVPAAINAAAEVLAKSPQGHRRELVIVSDFQRSNWTAADFTPLPADTQIQLESVAPTAPLENLAIVRAAVRGRVEAGGATRIELDVLNDARTPRAVQVEVTIGGQSLHGSATLPPRVRTTVPIAWTPTTAGWATGKARLLDVGDALPQDDQRPIAIEVSSAPTYVLLTRESAAPAPVSSHFVERALAPTGERVTRLDSQQIDRVALSKAALVVIDHAGKMSDSDLEWIAGMLRRGRGVLYIAAEPIDAINLASLARAAGSDWKLPVEFVPSSFARGDLFLSDWRVDAPGIALLGDSAQAAIAPLRFAGGLASRPIASGLKDDIFASFNDRSAAIVMSPCGAGNIAVLNADLARSNIISSNIFVPLIGELANRAISSRVADDACPSGQPLVASLASVAKPDKLDIVGPDDASVDLGEIVVESNQTLWRWPHSGPAGVYRVVDEEKAVVHAIATAAPAEESSLAPIDPKLLESRLAGGRTVQFNGGDDVGAKRDDTAWTWAMAGTSVFVLLELLTLLLFRN